MYLLQIREGRMLKRVPRLKVQRRSKVMCLGALVKLAKSGGCEPRMISSRVDFLIFKLPFNGVILVRVKGRRSVVNSRQDCGACLNQIRSDGSY